MLKQLSVFKPNKKKGRAPKRRLPLPTTGHQPALDLLQRILEKDSLTTYLKPENLFEYQLNRVTAAPANVIDMIHNNPIRSIRPRSIPVRVKLDGPRNVIA